MPAPSTIDEIIDRKVIQARTAHTITKALAALPGSADEIAEHFFTNGITGTHGGHDCPVARYLKAALAEVGITHRHAGVFVGPYSIYADERRDFVSDRPTWELHWTYTDDPRFIRPSGYTMPGAVVEFIANYDDNKYRHLDSTHKPKVEAGAVEVTVDEASKLVYV